MAEPKIKEKRWTIDLEKKIQEEHFAEGQRYTFDPKSEKEIFVVDTPPPYPSGTWHIGAVAQYSMIDVLARSQRLLGKEVYFPWGVDRNGINIEFTVEKKTGRKMKTYDRAEFLDICKNESMPHVLTKGHQVTCHLLDAGINGKWDLNSQKKTIPLNYPSLLPLVSVKNLKTHFPVKKGVFLRTVNHIRAVDNVNLEIPKGSTLALVGESGCGKTTLGESIIKLNSYAEGEVIFAGQDLMQLTGNHLKYFRKNMQMVFQDPFGSLQPRMNIEGIIGEGLEVHFPELFYELKLEKISRVMKEVGLSDSILERYPHEFSGGQRQRIAIARALILEPEFLVLDEPTSALDVSVQAQILNLLKDLQIKYSLTYLFISHNLSVVRYLANTVAIMYLGRIVEQGPAEDIFNNPKHPYTKSLLNSVPDLGERKPFEPLTGDVPSPLQPPAACHFHPRCPIYLEEEQGSSLAKKCVTEYPKISGEKNNFVRCHSK